MLAAVYQRLVEINGRSYAAASLVVKHIDAVEVRIAIAAVLAAAAYAVLVGPYSSHATFKNSAPI
jgi:FlaG/FlaF family flagellin (archaellin)